ncbi:acyltransferase family protein [Nitrobacteraceae bacterium UC4446_H13]
MSERKEIFGFDALRAFSVILVITSHIGIIEAATSPFWVRFFSVFNATYGVKTFFVLSGFLITTLMIKEDRTHGGVNVLNFMARRALRILPLYFLILSFIAMLIYLGIAQSSWSAMLFGALYIFNFIPKALSVNYMSHLWSLAVEEQFYLLWPLVFSLWIERKAVLILICCTVIAACWMTLGANYGDISHRFFTDRWTIPAIYPISIGAMMALCLGPWMKRVPAAVLALTLIATPLFVEHSNLLEIANTFGIGLLVAWIYLNQDRAIVQSLEWFPLKYIGMISYGLYMWQGLWTGNGPYRVIPGFPLEPHIGALVTLPCAIASFHLFERPISKRFKKYFPPDGGSLHNSGKPRRPRGRRVTAGIGNRNVGPGGASKIAVSSPLRGED